MSNNPRPLLASDPIGPHEQERAGADTPSAGSRPEASALSTANTDEPRAGATRTGAKSTPRNRGGLLAGMRNLADPSIASEPVYIDEQELARRTTLSRTTLQTMRRKGGGPPFAKLGHRIVYRLADVERWIADRTQTRAAS
jgi:predicted DNA-binding transcriptional regulator AlpA